MVSALSKLTGLVTRMPGSRHIINVVDFDTLVSYWRKPRSPLRWDCIFVIPPWLEVWWRQFGLTAELYLCIAKQKGTISGIAPLLIKGKEALFIGSADVCDYLDFVVTPGSEGDFFKSLLDHLNSKGINHLGLGPLRPDSTVLTHLVGIAKERGYKVTCEVEDVSVELDLPDTWEKYLGMLNGKQRHEVRRKLRKLWKTGEVHYRWIEDGEAVRHGMGLFLMLFRKGKKDKELFMTTERESFFKSLAEAMAQAGLLRLGILELDAKPVASTLCFDYNNVLYLYNSSYDPQYSSLSVGLISKVLCVKDSIERGLKKFDLLKGSEEYKYRLGGKEIPLYKCHLVLK